MIHLAGIDVQVDGFPEPESYPFNVPAISGTPSLEFTTSVTFFTGENGSGKTTLLEAIARLADIPMWEGERRGRAARNRWDGRLHEFARIRWSNGRVPGSWFSSESYKGLAEAMDAFAAADPGFLRYIGGDYLMARSHGQSTMAWFRARYSRRGLYLMDEPETALSPVSQLALVKLLARERPADAQFVIATHSPFLLACPDAVIYGFDGPGIEPIAYEETVHYRIFRDFMADRGKFLGGS